MPPNSTPDTRVIASVRSAWINNLPIINFQIEGINVDGLIDSGGAVCLISNDLFNTLKEKKVKMKFLGNRIRINTFDGGNIPFKKCVKITFKLNNIFTTGTFYVTNENFKGNYKVLLGYDYLKNNHMILDLQQSCLIVKNTKIPLHNGDHRINTCPVNVSTIAEQSERENNDIRVKKINNNNRKKVTAKLANRIFIAPGREKIVSLILSENLNPETTILFEPVDLKRGLLCGNSIHQVTNTNTINIILKNNDTKKIVLQKNTKMGNIDSEVIFKTEKDLNDIENGTLYEINNLSLEEVRKLRETELSIEDFDLRHLSGEVRQKMESLLMRHAHAFSKSYKSLGQTCLVTPRIKLHHDYPLQCKPYKTPHTIREYAREEIKKLLEANIIEKSNSNYAFPVLFVRKKSTDKQKQPKYRMAVDYRMLNEILEGYPYPVPDIKELLQRISGKQFYTVLDLHSAFFQINLRPEDKEKLAFVTEDGKYTSTRLNFGLKVSPTVFSELMDKVLGHFNKNEVGWYIDDLIVSANSIERMIQLLTEILQTLIDHNLTVEPSKMQICQEQIEFLGYKINKQGYSPSSKNIEKIQKLARPKNKKGVKSLLGLSNYFRSLIRNYSEIVNPLVELTKEKSKFQWNENTERAFLAIQEAIVQNPTLNPPDFNKDFFVITDASKVAISGVLAQKEGDEFKPVEFYGRKLKDSEKKYPSIKYELLAIHDTVKHFEHILLGRKFIILTDSKALTYHLNLEKQSDITARWLMKLADFDYTIEHIEGKNNPSDFISRHINSITSQNELQNNLFKVNLNLSEENVKNAQRSDSKLSVIIKKIEDNKQNKNTRKFELNHNNTLILKQKYKDKELLIAPNNLIFEIIQEAHKPHFGFPKTYETVKSRFFWYGMYKDIKSYCASCIACNKAKQHQTIKVPVQKVVKDKSVGEALHIDIVGKLNVTFRKNAFILTIIDSTSRYLEAIPLRGVDSQLILNALNNYFSSYGICKTIILDNGPYFRSDVFKEYLKALNIELHFSTIYKPTANGILESQHKGLKSSLRAMCRTTTEWDIRLPFFKLAHNTSINRATKYTPAKLFFAREIPNHFTVLGTSDEKCTHEFVKQRIKHIKEVHKLALANQELIMSEYVNDFQKVKTLNLGDQVYLKKDIRPRTLEDRFEGPYEIIKACRNNTYRIKHMIDHNARTMTRHITQLFHPKAKIDSSTTEENDTQNE